jgi:lipoprotein NlpD
VVKRGDTLFQIALDHGHDWRDLARWNNLDDPSRIFVGQRLRLIPPETAVSPVAVAPPVKAVPLPSAGSTPAAAPATSSGAPSPAPTQAPTPAPAPATAPTQAPVPAEERIDWAWPANGKVIETFDEQRNKGIDIAGNLGDPVLAAADGKVVYAGSGLRGYGNLLIIKHNNTFLSAYAHNRQLLVREGQLVRRGQLIAELGNSDAPSPRLHFEIRRQGRPIDPLAQLPARP